MPPFESLSHDYAHLQDRNGVITSQEKIALETTLPSYEVETYYKEKWNTTLAILQLFDWQIYQKNYDKSSPKHQIFIIKMMTGWLPVYHQLNKMATTKLKCPKCNQEETIPHLFQCQSRTTWANTFMSNLKNFLNKLHTSTTFMEKAIPYFHEMINNSTDFDQFKQFTIFAGLLPIAWKIEATNNDDTEAPDVLTQQQWATKFSAWLTQQGHEVWILRNNQVHNKEEQTTTIHRTLNQKIRRLYTLQDSIGYNDRDIFATPLEDRLGLTEKQKMAWISQTTNTLKVCMAEYQDKMTTGQKDIRQFLISATVKPKK